MAAVENAFTEYAQMPRNQDTKFIGQINTNIKMRRQTRPEKVYCTVLVSVRKLT
jgi:hypothetical protein